MKILIRNSDSVVLFAGNLTLTAEGLTGKGFRADFCTTENSTLADADLPEHFEGGLFAYDGEWSVVDQARFDAKVEAAFKATVPAQVTMRQARLALYAAGLLNTVQTAIASAGQSAVIEWDYATVVERNAGLVPDMAAALGMTERQIDDLFISAAAL